MGTELEDSPLTEQLVMNTRTFVLSGMLLVAMPGQAGEIPPPAGTVTDEFGDLVPRALAQLIVVDGTPRWKRTRAGYSSFSYDGEWLIAEHGPHGSRATYVYGWGRQLVGILYQDGTSVLAQYNAHGILDSLQSCRGKVVRFEHPDITPRSAEFHRALAQLAEWTIAAPTNGQYRTAHQFVGRPGPQSQ